MADTHSSSDHIASTDRSDVHHEESDVNIRAIFGFGAALAAVALVIHVAVGGLFWYFNSREAASQTARPFAADDTRLPPEPRLQQRPRQDMQDLRAREDQILNAYSWADRNAGTVRIPIGEAMKLTLQKGLPVREPAGDQQK
jgi:hypothetical protein